MKASVVELRHKMKEIMAALDRNEAVTITYRGKDRAVMIPVEQAKRRISASEHPACGMWKNRREMKDVPAWIRKMRRGRVDAF